MSKALTIVAGLVLASVLFAGCVVPLTFPAWLAGWRLASVGRRVRLARWRAAAWVAYVACSIVLCSNIPAAFYYPRMAWVFVTVSGLAWLGALLAAFQIGARRGLRSYVARQARVTRSAAYLAR